MFAIVEIAGKQFKVEKGKYVYVNRLDAKEDSVVEFDKVLLLNTDDNKVSVGTPVVEGAKVEAKVLQHLKGNKVLVFKKKRRKGYQTLNGHRDFLTKIEIENIVF
ncbi:MAG: 50S ribosomal protein L21 [Bacteroidales bacterium]|nr:50S ribosomal protein L21 [Bacteroidales bacterium]